jgi:putative mRNA 3-end processing factor
MYPIDVLGSGAVVLGPLVVCDGFQIEHQIRVQSHVHDDHMIDFETSKGFQDLVMSEGTYLLLEAEFNADLSIRRKGGNLHVLQFGEAYSVDNTTVSLIPNQHMLGAAQVSVDMPGGVRLGYSSDFSWPLEDDQQLKCDALVVDCTYGSPASIREYSQAEAESRLIELIRAKLKSGPIHLKGFRGTIQRALQLVSSELDVPVVGGNQLCRELQAYQELGSVSETLIPWKSPEGGAAMSCGRYIRLYSKGDRFPPQVTSGTTISLSAFMTDRRNPVLEFSQRAYRVALSDHADFVGTLEYVRATEAKFVVTDNTRGGHGITLAREIQSRLGIEARPSSNYSSLAWGQ